MTEWIDVAGRDQIADGEMIAVDANGLPIVLFNLSGSFSALHDLCTHGQARLSDGFVDGDCIECPLHQGKFDIRTGAPAAAPVTEAVRAFPVRLNGDRIEIDVSAA